MNHLRAAKKKKKMSEEERVALEEELEVIIEGASDGEGTRDTSPSPFQHFFLASPWVACARIHCATGRHARTKHVFHFVSYFKVSYSFPTLGDTDRAKAQAIDEAYLLR